MFKKRFLSILLTLLMVVTLLPTAVLAETGEVSETIDENEQQTVVDVDASEQQNDATNLLDAQETENQGETLPDININPYEENKKEEKEEVKDQTLLNSPPDILLNSENGNTISSYDELKTAVESGGEWKLASGFEFEVTSDTATALTIKKDFTLDLNGYTVTGKDGNGSYPMFWCNAGAMFTVKDTSDGENGKLLRTTSGYSEVSGVVAMSSSYSHLGNFTLESGTIELNSTASNSSSKAYAINAAGNSTTKPAIIINGGSVISKNTTAANSSVEVCAIYQGKYTTLTINGGTIKALADSESSAVCVRAAGSNGLTTINAGTFYADGRFAVDVTACITNPSANLTVNGGYFCHTGGVDIRALKSNTFSINGGVYAHDLSVIAPAEGYEKREINVTIGEVTYEYIVGKSVTTDNGKVTGGTFDFDPTACLAEGYEATESGGKWTVETATPVPTQKVAKIGENEYASLSEAVVAANANDMITLLEDINTAETLTIPADKIITLNLNGKTITYTGNDKAIAVAGNLTIGGKGTTVGTVTATKKVAIGLVPGSVGAKLTIKSGTFNSVEGAVVTSTATGATIDISNGTFTATDNAVIAGNGSARDGEPNTINITTSYPVFNGSITSPGYLACGIYAPWKDIINVSGGKFNITDGIGIVARAGKTTISGEAQFSVTGESTTTGKVGDKDYGMQSGQVFYFDDTDPAYPAYSEGDGIFVQGGSYSEKPNADYLADGVVVAVNSLTPSSTQYKVCALLANNPYGTDGVCFKNTRTGIYYTLFANAFNKDEYASDDTIEVLNDFNSRSTQWTLEPRNLTIDIKEGVTFGGGQPFVIPMGANVTFTGKGTFAVNTRSSNALVINGGSVTISEGFNVLENAGGGSTTSSTTSCVLFGQNGGILNTAGNLQITHHTSNAAVIQTNGSEGNLPVIINITGGSITNNSGVGIYQPQCGELNISGGTITGTTALYVKSGKTTITGGTIKGTGAKEDYTYWDNGCYTTGDALVIDNCGYPGGTPVVSVTGGQFYSTNANAVASYAYGNEGDVVRTPITGFLKGGIYGVDTEAIDISNKNLIAEGYKDIQNPNEKTKEDYPWMIGEMTYVAQIGTGDTATKFETLTDAIIAAAHMQDTSVQITLLNSAELDVSALLEAAPQHGIDLTKLKEKLSFDTGSYSIQLNDGTYTEQMVLSVISTFLFDVGGKYEVIGNDTTLNLGGLYVIPTGTTINASVLRNTDGNVNGQAQRLVFTTPENAGTVTWNMPINSKTQVVVKGNLTFGGNTVYVSTAHRMDPENDYGSQERNTLIDVSGTLSGNIEVKGQQASTEISAPAGGVKIKAGTNNATITAAAKIGDVYYATLKEAAKQAKDNDAVTILSNCSADNLELNNTITVDLNGKTVTLGETSISAGKKVTIKDDAETKGGLVCNGAITVNGTLDVSALGYGTSGLIGGKPGSLAISATGKVALMSSWDSYSAAWLDANSSAFFVGTADGAKIVKANGDTRFVRVDGHWTVENAVAKIKRYVGGDTSKPYYDTYATLQDAFDDAKDGETIEMLKSIESSNTYAAMLQKVNGEAITLDLMGKTIAATNKYNIINYAGTLIVKDSVGSGEIKGQNLSNQTIQVRSAYGPAKLVLESGKISSTGLAILAMNGTIEINGGEVVSTDKYANGGLTVRVGYQNNKDYASSLKMTGGKITAQSCYGVQVLTSSSVDISGGTIETYIGSIFGNGTAGYGDTTINISGTAQILSENIAMYLPQRGEVNISGGLVQGYAGIGIKSGTLNISGGSIVGTANDTVWTTSINNGMYNDGSAICIDSNSAYVGGVDVNITGGEIKGIYSYAIHEIGKAAEETSVVNIDISDGKIFGGTSVSGECFAIRPITEPNVELSGGHYSSKPKADYIVEGKKAIEDTQEYKSLGYNWTIGVAPVVPQEDPVAKETSKNNTEVPQGAEEGLAQKVVEEVIDKEIKNNTAVSGDEATNIQSKAVESKIKTEIEKTSGVKLVDSTSQLKITVKSVATKTTKTQISDISASTVTTTSAKYDVKPYVTIETTTETGTTTETRQITNKELQEAGVSIAFRLAVPESMKGNEVLVKHYPDGTTVPDWSKTYAVQGEGNNRYVALEANSFSVYEIADYSTTEYVALNLETNVPYTDLETALSDAETQATSAENARTIVLLKDLTGEKKVTLIEVAPNVTLDLNGHKLEAKTTMAWGLVKDSSSTGKLITAKDHFAYFGGKEISASSENVMPVWDTLVGGTNGYVFCAVESIGKEWQYGIGDHVHNPKYRFQPHGIEIVKILKEDSGVKMFAEFNYTKTTVNDQGEQQTHDYHLIVEFGRTFIEQFLQDTTNTVMYVSLLGTENVSSISARTYLIAEESNLSIVSDWITTSTTN